ncbi:hypothetical protein WLQ65_10735 [Pseudoalteromonas piscicida]|uniref:hypothetical protein n=1 Tax=Pseudoalteromonas piscicida TaxID=43662 RepID=UPI0030C9A35E
MLKINQYEEDFEELIADSPIIIENRKAQIDDKTLSLEQRKEALFTVAEEYLDLGYAYYMLEENNKSIVHFQKAMPYKFKLAFEALWKEPENCWSIQETLNCILLFGTKELKSELIDSNWKLENEDIINESSYLYDRLLIQIGTTFKVDDAALINALNVSELEKDRDVQQFIVPLLRAIKGLITSDKSQWQIGIDKALQWHTDEAKLGEYRDIRQGVICLNALTLAKLGRDMHEWECTSESIYLPLNLLNLI